MKINEFRNQAHELVDWMADYLLTEAGVAVLPGTSFGHYGEGYLRLCFATSLESIQQAVAWIADALEKLT